MSITTQSAFSTIIYGIMENITPQGVQAHAIDGITGEIITSHFCSSEGMAKSDLGFIEPILRTDVAGKEHSTVVFNKQVQDLYKEKYPSGYQLIWVGKWWDNPITAKLYKKFNS